MAALLSALGLDVKILIAQIVNFIVLGFILYKIGYQPILKFVKDRTTKIEEGVKQAEEVKQTLAQAKTEQASIISTAKSEAQKIFDAAKLQATEQATQIVERSKTEAGKVIDKAKQDIRLEHDKMLTDAKAELAHVVLLATEKLLKTKLDAPTDAALIEKTLQEIA